MSREYIEIDCMILHMTADAVYLDDGDVSNWVPRSLIKDGELLGEYELNKQMTLEVEEWVAIEKGLV